MALDWQDPALAQAAEVALGKIMSVLPPAARAAAQAMAVYAPPTGLEPAVQATLQTLREAIQARRKLQLDYSDVSGQPSQRVVRPLGCFYWGKVWTLAAWCETRQAFRNFRLDRIAGVQSQEATFRDEVGKTLADFLRLMGASSVI